MKQAFQSIFVLALLALGALPEIAQAQTLGRLFSSPQERRELDAKRDAKPIRPPAIKSIPPLKQDPVIPAQAASYTPPPPPPKPTVINGFVRRSDGPNTVWLNEKPVSGSAARDEWLQPSAVNSPVRVQSSTR